MKTKQLHFISIFFLLILFYNCGQKSPNTNHEKENKETVKETVKPKSGPIWTITKADINKPLDEFTAVDGYLFVSTYDEGVFVSKDGGENWDSLSGLSPKIIHAISANDNEILFAGTGIGLYRSKNKGATWTEINNKLPHETFWINTIFNYKETVFLGTSKGLFKSTNGGDNWTECSNGMRTQGNEGNYDPAKDIQQITGDGETLFVATKNGVFSSTDGNNWFYKGSGLIDKYDIRVSSIYTIAICGNTVIAGTENHLFSSTNNGDNWQILETGIKVPYDSKSDYMMDIKFFHNLYVYNNNVLGVFNGTLCVSNNGGETWEIWENGIEDESIRTAFVNENNIILGTAKGKVWMTDVAALK